MFKQYKRKAVAEMRPVTENDTYESLVEEGVSISEEDRKNGSPKVGDMIARNPKNHKDQWLVAKEYFEDNFEEIDGTQQKVLEILEEGVKASSKNESPSIFGFQVILHKDNGVDITRGTDGDVDVSSFLSALHLSLENILREGGFDPESTFKMFAKASADGVSQNTEKGEENDF